MGLIELVILKDLAPFYYHWRKRPVQVDYGCFSGECFLDKIGGPG
jgi:hypothetical protein